MSFPAPAPPVRVEAAGRPERVEPEGRPERIEPEGQPEHIETEAKPERIEPRLDPGGVPPLAQERQEPSLQPVRPQPQPRPEAATERPDPFSMRAADAKQRESQDQQALEEEQAARRERRKRPSAIERQARKLEATVQRVDLDDVRQLAPGTWLELVDGQGDQLVCCKISEGLGTQQQFYFVSRRGFGEFALSTENLARQLADGRARTLGKGPLVGRVMLRLAGVLRRDAEAADDPSPPKA